MAYKCLYLLHEVISEHFELKPQLVLVKSRHVFPEEVCICSQIFSFLLRPIKMLDLHLK